MTDAEVEARAQALLARYPYDPEARPASYPIGSPERLRGVPEDMREILARIYVNAHPRWVQEADLELRRKYGKPELHVEDPTAERYR